MRKKLDDDIARLSPDSLMDIFSKTSFGAGIAASIVLHALLVLSTSAGYIWNRINPPAPKPVNELSATNAVPSNATATATDTGVVAVADDTNSATSNQMTAHEALMEKHKDSPVVQRVTETAKPEDTPDTPEDIGIPIESTNPF